MREFLKGLELDSETTDKIMAEYGKSITKSKEEIEGYKKEIETYKKSMDDLKNEVQSLKEDSKNSEDLQKKYDELNKKIEEQRAEEKAKQEDTILTHNITEAIGDKKFVNEYTKNSIINEIKTALQNEANIGKSAKDLFNEITEGKTGLFLNSNQMVDMPPIDENVDSVITKEAFDKMGYKERVELKQSNPELFAKYNA